MKTIILSCAHGAETPGKRSPDGKHREYRWSRDVQYRIAAGLKAYGIPFVLIPAKGVDAEPGLYQRVQQENLIAAPAFVFSLHNNAAGSGAKWMTARGVSIWTCKGKTESDRYATQIFDTMQKDLDFIGHWRTDYFRDGDADWEENFTELMSIHPAVLLEYLFQDNVEDVEILQDEEYTRRFVNCAILFLHKIATS
jgi:N-acetylmuramoyl-L-alanine amidase